MADQAPEALSVATALAIAKGQLEKLTLRIIGEVSELSNKPGYSAVYFTLKDQQEKAALPCLMWMNRFKAAGVDFKVGSLVEVTGKFSLYAAKGRMNFDVSTISLAGEGDIRLKIARLAKKLEAEGLTSTEAKLPLPRLPQRIGLVTSPRGAAVYDVLRTLRRRYPLAEVIVAGVPVEGQDAPAHLKEALNVVAAAGVDVVLLVRGGGSFEDLMPFNDEGLARHIAALKVPVVTGIGHEPDTSIADMVADLRASTPTAAAEAVVPAIADLKALIQGLGRRMGFAQSALLSRAQRVLLDLRGQSCFADPLALIRDDAQAVDELSGRLEAAIPQQLHASASKAQELKMRLVRLGPGLIQGEQAQLTRLSADLKAHGRTLLDPFQKERSIMAAKLEGLSPLAVLSRGYAAVFTPEGRVISSVEDVAVGSRIDVEVADGILGCTVDTLGPSTRNAEKGSTV